MSGFAPTLEQDELRQMVSRLLAKRSTSADVRRWMESDQGFDRALWSEITDLGLPALGLPESGDDSGSTIVDLVIVSEEIGYTLACIPLLASTLALQALAGCSTSDAARLSAAALRGDSIATLALASVDGVWSTSDSPVRAAPEANEYRLSGTLSYVLDGAGATVIIVPAKVGDALALFSVEVGAAGAEVIDLPSIDLTRRLSQLHLHGASATLVGTVDETQSAVTNALHVASVVLAAEQLGVARRCLDMAVEYAKLRHQFGKPIGSFQAIKHKCAEMLIAVESARSATYDAAQQIDDRTEDIEASVLVAKIVGSDAAFDNAAENIQIHGGIGFTWEHDAHLYFKRAKSAQLLLGDNEELHRRLADVVGIA